MNPVVKQAPPPSSSATQGVPSDSAYAVEHPDNQSLIQESSSKSNSAKIAHGFNQSRPTPQEAHRQQPAVSVPWSRHCSHESTQPFAKATYTRPPLFTCTSLKSSKLRFERKYPCCHHCSTKCFPPAQIQRDPDAVGVGSSALRLYGDVPTAAAIFLCSVLGFAKRAIWHAEHARFAGAQM